MSAGEFCGGVGWIAGIWVARECICLTSGNTSSILLLVSTTQPKITGRYDRLRRSLAEIGFVCKGSMVRRHMPCGQPRCRCAKGPDHWHGPYYQWTRKVKGKTVTVRLTLEEAELMSSYVRNDRQLRRIVAQMRAISLGVVQAQVKAVSRRRKSTTEHYVRAAQTASRKTKKPRKGKQAGT